MGSTPVPTWNNGDVGENGTKGRKKGKGCREKNEVNECKKETDTRCAGYTMGRPR